VALLLPKRLHTPNIALFDGSGRERAVKDKFHYAIQLANQLARRTSSRAGSSELDSAWNLAFSKVQCYVRSTAKYTVYSCKTIIF